MHYHNPPTLYNTKDCVHEAYILDWYRSLRTTDELLHIFRKESMCLSSFFRTLENTTVQFWYDGRGTSMVIWTGPWFDAVTFSLWIRQDKRKTKFAYRNLIDTYTHLFEHYPTIVGLTKQANLLDEHIKLGYTIQGCIPSIWDGEDAYLVVLTKEHFYGHRVPAPRAGKDQYERKQGRRGICTRVADTDQAVAPGVIRPVA